MKIMVTGGAGYIGSHTCVELLNAGFDVVVLDNLSTGSMESIRRIKKITGKSVEMLQSDVRRAVCTSTISAMYEVDAVIHFAGLKAVGESVANPLMYYDHNVVGSIELLKAMNLCGVKKILFSSSATVYGDPDCVPISETAELHPTNPYGRTKLVIEGILGDLTRSDPSWSVGALRYFNPIGAHESGLLGESGPPNNLVPYIAQVAVGRREKLSVYGGDYPTPDGTGIRDYIHVVDLAKGHVAALKKILDGESFTVNLGTGVGYSVLQVVDAFERASGVKVPYEIVERRPGDVAECLADPSLAKKLLGWEAEKGLDEMCDDHWRWQQENPHGF